MSSPDAVESSAQDDDDALMRAYAHGDASAFDRLYARHRAGLYRFVRRLLGASQASAVDEVYQDAWLRVVHARERWQPQGATFRTWLYTIAQNRAIDVLRRSGREVAMPDNDDDRPPFEPQGTPWNAWPEPSAAAPAQDDALFWRRAGAKLLDCLAQLPIAQKAVFLMHHEDGETLDTIANSLGVGFETAKSRLRYAMSKLRTCMGAYLAPTLGGES
jgi:RNA polymerase sigma factor (sigma-70 family)